MQDYPQPIARRKARLADVARQAGVSVATASRALSGNGPVSATAHARVIDAANRLDFSPSALGRSLRTQRSRVVGFVVPDISSPFYALALKGTQHRLEAAGYRVTLMDTDERPDLELAAIHALAAQGVEGIVICSSGANPKTLEAAVGRASVPVVFFDNFVPGVGYGSVALSNEEGIRILVDHLAQTHGHTRIGYVGGLIVETSGRERLTGFRRGLAQNGLALDEALIRDGNWTHEAGSRQTAALLATDPPPTAIVFVDAFTALGGLVAIRNSGLRVPEDVAVVSFDDWDAGEVLDPSLTALAQRGLQVGDLAASLLVRALEHTIVGGIDVRIPMELIVRRSCGCNA